MVWTPIPLEALTSLIEKDLARCAAEDRELFDQSRIEPVRWTLSP